MSLPRLTLSKTLRALVPAALLATSGALVAAPAQAAASTYFVSPNGSDSADGRSASTPWRTLDRAGRVALQPGDRLLLLGGSTFSGSRGLNVASSGTASAPVVVGSYGDGSATIAGSPGDCVTVSGSYVTLTRLAVNHCYYAGIGVRGDHVSMSSIDASWSWAGIQATSTASYTSITSSGIHDNTRPTSGTSGSNDDSGAFGVLVNGDHTTITGTAFARQDVASPDYGRDGAAVEVYGGTVTTVQDNTGTDNQTFVEVGGQSSAQSAHLLIRGNTVTTKAAKTYFVVVHAGDGFGTAADVSVQSNRATLPGASSIGVYCGPKCTTSVLGLNGNALSAAKAPVYVQGSYSGS